MKLTKSLTISSLVLLFSGCTKDSESDLINNPSNNESTTYTGTVRDIVNNNCVMCHANPPVEDAPMSLATYEDVKNAVLTRGLLDRISRPQGSSGMMPDRGTRLPQNTIDQIIKWQNDGLLE
jgi:uncharacterized membrane protein